jgi:hypothetical protein
VFFDAIQADITIWHTDSHFALFVSVTFYENPRADDPRSVIAIMVLNLISTLYQVHQLQLPDYFCWQWIHLTILKF